MEWLAASWLEDPGGCSVGCPITASALLLIHPIKYGDDEMSDEFCMIDMALFPLFNFPYC